MYHYTNVLKRTSTRRTRQKSEPISKSKFYTQQDVYETMSRDNPQSYELQGPVVQCKSYEDNEIIKNRNMQGNEITSTSKLNTVAKLPSIINN